MEIEWLTMKTMYMKVHSHQQESHKRDCEKIK